MTLVRSAVCVIAAALVVAQSQASDLQATRRDSLRESLQRAVADYAERTHAPAVGVGVVVAGDVLVRTAVGLQRSGQDIPATSRTIFHMASVSKPVVATAIMQLVEAGRVALDAQVSPLVPAFRLNDARWQAVTVSQLLNHTSGLPDVEDYEWQRPQYDADALDRYLRTWRDRQLVAAPGTRFAYSNLGYEVLAGLIQHVSGQEFERYMKANLLDPLGMVSSTFYLPDAEPSLLAWPHERDERGLPRPAKTFPYNRAHAASSTLYSNVDDMLRFMQLHLAGQDAAAVGLSARTLMLQHAPSAIVFQHTIPIDRHPAFGWFEMHWRGRRLVVHEGQDDGFTTLLLTEPAAKNGVVLLLNLNSPDSSRELWALALQLLDQLPH